MGVWSSQLSQLEICPGRIPRRDQTYNKIEIKGLDDVDIDICARNRLQMTLEVLLAR